MPGFPKLREALLPLAASFAQLPDDVKCLYEDEASSFNVGWSCAKEVLENGQPDRFKGSFYANPATDIPTTDETLLALYPSDLRPNIWPTEHLPQLEKAFKDLGALIIDVGQMLLKHCDAYVEAKLLEGGPGLWNAVAASSVNKGRLLHYFPHNPNTKPADDEQNWCGWHKDHGLLTGLTSAMYLDANGQQGECKDPGAGLHVRDRSGNVVRVAIGQNELAFQVGEVMQILSGGLLQATPHGVFGPKAALSDSLSRNTFAVFMQPNFDHLLVCPAGAEAAVGVDRWQGGEQLTFGEFAQRTFDVYYKKRS